jgi:multiple sugar transport system permease protein
MSTNSAAGVASRGMVPLEGGRKRRRARNTPYWMVLPIALFLSVFTAYPFLYNLVLSTKGYILSRPNKTPFVGLGNFGEVLGGFYFREAVGNTLVYTALLLVGTTVLGFTIALLMTRPGKAAALLRILVILPWAIPPTVAGTIWKWMWSGDFGLINGVLTGLGIIDKYQPWLAGSTTAMIAVAVAAIWRETPLSAILLLGGLQSIPDELYEAAQMDGATVLARIRHVTIPLLRPFLTVVLVFQTINALITFDLLYVMTGGGPGTATQLLSWYAYSEIFKFLNVGHGAAMAFILALLSLVIVTIYLRVIRSEQVY